VGFFKITKSAKKLSRSAIEYLDKDKDQLTKKQIEYNKAYSKFKQKPSDELRSNLESLRKELGEHKDIWEKKSHSDIRLSGFLRKELYQKGYGKLDKKEQVNLILKTWNEKLASVHNKKDYHVGLRRYVVAPSIQDMKKVSIFEFNDYCEDSLRISNVCGKQFIEENKERIDSFFDDLVRDTMQRFKDKYVAKGDDIGYAFSIHHDTKVPHAHIYLLPYSRNGDYLSMNSGRFLKGTKMKKLEQKFISNSENKLDFLKLTSERQLQKHLKQYQILKKMDKHLYRDILELSTLKPRQVQEKELKKEALKKQQSLSDKSISSTSFNSSRQRESRKTREVEKENRNGAPNVYSSFNTSLLVKALGLDLGNSLRMD
jgi:hypothetical protein